MSILNFKKTFISKSYLTISLLGKSYKLNIKYTTSTNVSLTKKDVEFILTLPKKYKNCDNIESLINQAVEKLYSEVAPKEIEDSLELARYILKFAPEDYKIKRLSTGFYKSIKKSILIINPDIIKYSKEIINTTMIQEFCRMMYGVKTKKYKTNLMKALKDYEEYKEAISKEVKLIYKIN